jgi:addiction module HigA family antidote
MINGAFVSYGLILGLPTWKLLITTETRGTAMAKLKNVHPGEVLLEEFLVPMKLSQNALARAIGVPPRRINEIVLGKRSITADTALRLAKTFGTSEGFWLGLQADYDVEETRKIIAKDLAHVERIAA